MSPLGLALNSTLPGSERGLPCSGLGASGPEVLQWQDPDFTMTGVPATATPAALRPSAGGFQGPLLLGARSSRLGPLPSFSSHAPK